MKSSKNKLNSKISWFFKFRAKQTLNINIFIFYMSSLKLCIKNKFIDQLVYKIQLTRNFTYVLIIT